MAPPIPWLLLERSPDTSSNKRWNLIPSPKTWVGDFLAVCVCAELLQCLTLCDPMDHSLPGSSVHWILQARILESVAMPSYKGSSRPRDWTMSFMSPALAGGFFTTSAIWEALWSTSNCKVYCLISKCFDIFLISFYHWIFSLIPFWAVWLGFF